MTRFVFKRRIGCGAAFIAAYALVFNLILSSILVAGVSPAAAAAAHELCSGIGNSGTVRTDADKSDKKRAIHCPLCVGHHTPTSVPPPQADLLDRQYVEVVIAFAFEARFVAPFRSHDHQSRGPPFLT
ncbi:DUF2946 family protein [Bradyrhizobium sp. 195]|uniref:DUF2946 family protein n=1 Tax=Bradyrhizobium sp. 195 TaxID=2782662 RepID=UPI0020009816|nr:DUF2946 domain-containing protein [Bradyrhizobium sp. 195]UPK31137.1 DUF2946 domain-containing protein [Bradyrhizobium sp. 195]